MAKSNNIFISVGLVGLVLLLLLIIFLYKRKEQKRQGFRIGQYIAEKRAARKLEEGETDRQTYARYTDRMAERRAAKKLKKEEEGERDRQTYARYTDRMAERKAERKLKKEEERQAVLRLSTKLAERRAAKKLKKEEEEEDGGTAVSAATGLARTPSSSWYRPIGSPIFRRRD